MVQAKTTAGGIQEYLSSHLARKGRVFGFLLFLGTAALIAVVNTPQPIKPIPKSFSIMDVTGDTPSFLFTQYQRLEKAYPNASKTDSIMFYSSSFTRLRRKFLGLLDNTADNRGRVFQTCAMGGSNTAQQWKEGLDKTTGFTYIRRIETWLANITKKFNAGARFRFVNGGRGASNTAKSTEWLNRSIPSDCDLIIWEYSINDFWGDVFLFHVNYSNSTSILEFKKRHSEGISLALHRISVVHPHSAVAIVYLSYPLLEPEYPVELGGPCIEYAESKSVEDYSRFIDVFGVSAYHHAFYSSDWSKEMFLKKGWHGGHPTWTHDRTVFELFQLSFLRILLSKEFVESSAFNSYLRPIPIPQSNNSRFIRDFHSFQSRTELWKLTGPHHGLPHMHKLRIGCATDR